MLFPDDGITKGDLAAYHALVAPLMLPHLQGRPITMERYPAGIGKQVCPALKLVVDLAHKIILSDV